MRLISPSLVCIMSSWTVAADVIIVPLFTDGSAPVNDLDPISLQPIETLVGLVKTQQWTNARLTADLLAEQFEGLPRFDLYLGLLQMAEGDFNEAIFSFERVLIFVPDQHRARLELGRAYFLSANYDRARSELEQVLATAPPPEVRQNINQLLSRIDRAQSQARTRISFGGTLLGGWDNNGNGGGNAKGLLDPNLSGATALDSASSAIASPYAQLTLHASRFRPTSRSASRRLSADFSTKNFIDPELSDSSALTLTSTVFSQNERLRFQLPASAQWSWLAGQNWQAMLDLSLSQQYNIWGPLWAGVKLGTVATLALDPTNSSGAKDLAGLVFDAQERGRVHSFSTVYLQTQLAGQDDGHLEWRGLANRYQLGWQGPWQVQANLAVEHQWRQYKANDLFFTLDEASTDLKRRQDQVIRLDLGVNWGPADWLETRTAINWEWVSSNINAYGSDRFTISQAMSVQF
jgi:hypothetical protein